METNRMKPQYVLIHCQPTLLNFIRENNMQWTYSPIHGKNEIDVIVNDIPYEIRNGKYEDPDAQLCEHYGIDYDQVNCIEAVN